MVLLAAFPSSVYFVFQKPHLEKKYGALAFTTHAIWAGTLLTLVLLPGLVPQLQKAPAGTTLALIYLGVFPTAISYVTYAYAFSRMAASRAVSFPYIIPVTAYLIAWVWLGEVPTVVSVVGGVMTLSGVLIINTAVGGGSCCRITRPRTEREARDVETEKQTRHVINPKTCIGHVHLKVANIERALGFYRDILGFEITQWYGEDAVFLSAGGYHHHIGLNTWMSRNASPTPRNAAGLYHLAILYPSRSDLAQALSWLLEANYPIDGASDHGVSEALYLRDPDDNGVELAADRPEERWPRDRDGNLAMVTRPLDVEDLLAELGD